MATEVFCYTPERGPYKIVTDSIPADTPQIDIRPALEREYAERGEVFTPEPIVRPGRSKIPAWDVWRVWYESCRAHLHQPRPYVDCIYFGLK